MKLIVTIPALNEEKSIGSVVRSVPRQIDGIDKVEVLLVNDGSTDNTVTEAQKAGVDIIIHNEQNIGLARSFKKALNASLAHGADIIVNTDADGQYEQTEIPELIKPIIEKKAGMVIGDRQVAKLPFMKAGNKYGNLLGSWVLRMLTGTKIEDASSGFRAFSRDTAMQLNIYNTHTYTHETIIQAHFNKIATAQIPITFKERGTGGSRLIKSLYTHIKNSGLVIIRTILLYQPLRTLFFTGLLIMSPGIILGLRFVYLYLSGNGAGKIQSLILASMLIIIGFVVIVLGLIGDLIAKNRKLNEEMLYILKKEQSKK